MARTPLLEKTGSIRILGAIFIALLLFMVWVTYAFFDKQFVSSETVYVTTERTGVNLPQNADVKLRGMIVGEIRSIDPYNEGVRMTVAMKPEMMDQIPRDVTGQLLPKTLFGEKFLALIPADDPSGETLRPGDTIAQATVPIEVEELLNNAHPLLTAVDPANLSYTLTAISTALTGRGEELGDTLVTANDYLTELNPEIPQLVADLDQLGDVADGYSAVMPDLGRLLENATTTSNTVTSQRQELAAFFDETTRLANSLTDFTDANKESIPALAADSREFLEMVADYAPTMPCFLKGMRGMIPQLDSAFRDQQLNIDLKLIPPPTAYTADESLVIAQDAFDQASTGTAATSGSEVDGTNAALPTCLDLNEINAATGVGDEPRGESDPSNDDRDVISQYAAQPTTGQVFTVPPSVYKLANIHSTHGKFPGTNADYQRISPASASMGGFSSPAAVEAMRVLLGASLGQNPDDVPDLATIMLSPVVQGAGVTTR